MHLDFPFLSPFYWDSSSSSSSSSSRNFYHFFYRSLSSLETFRFLLLDLGEIEKEILRANLYFFISIIYRSKRNNYV